MSRQTCYIAGPFAGTDNDDRVVWLGCLAMAMGYAPVVIHPAIRLGVYGDDSDGDARIVGLDAAKAIAEACDDAWCLYRDDGTMSDGCRHELYHRRYRGGTWAEWQAVARVLHPGILELASEPAPEPARKIAPPWVNHDGVATRAGVARAVGYLFGGGGASWHIMRESGPFGGAHEGGLTDAMCAADGALIDDGWELS